MAALLFASPAMATYEPAGHFGGSATSVKAEDFGEEVQLTGVGGLAVNYTGAGGVPTGTVYAAAEWDGKMFVSAYVPAGAGLSFWERWMVNPSSLEGTGYERCGPALGSECSVYRGFSGARSVDVDIDQTNGNVFFYGGGLVINPNEKVIAEFSPNGATEITRFGEGAPSSSDTVADSPGRIHSGGVWGGPGNIAVDASGTVFSYDSDGKYKRLMVFKPQSPGDYAHYQYVGEVATVHEKGEALSMPVLDDAGNIYVGERLGGTHIKEYGPESPSSYPGPAATPICDFKVSKSGITAITVNPDTGEVFYATFKKEVGFTVKVVHQLSACDEETGEFTEIGKLEVKPERDDLYALAVDPLRRLEPSREPGVLYGAAPEGGSSSGVGDAEPGQSALGYIFTGPLALPPVVKSESVNNVGVTTAEVGAEIDPRGSEVRYSVEYLTEAEYEANEPADRFAGAMEAPQGGAVGGSQKVFNGVAVLSGLNPDASYRFRVVATSHCSSTHPEEVCEGTGAGGAFHTFPIEAPGLPDNRVYELVSPSQKNGGEVFPAQPTLGSCFNPCKPEFSTGFTMRSSPDGEAVVYEGQPFSFAEGAVGENEYIARRTATGWGTTTLSPPLARRDSGAGYVDFSTDLGKGLLTQINNALSPEAPSGYSNVYSQLTSNFLGVSPLLGQEPPNRLPGELQLSYAGASADLSRIFFAANDALTGETPFAPEAVDGGAGKNNLYEWSNGELRLVNVDPDGGTEPGATFGGLSAQHAISADGTRAFWSDAAGQLYVRENGETTEEIPDTSKFLSAATDGSKVLLKDGKIFNVDNLAEEPVDLAQGKAGFKGIAGQSEDLSRVYFVDTDVLAGEAQEGEDNLYSFHAGTTSFIATLIPEDNTGLNEGAWSDGPSVRTAEASPDGRWLAFLSRKPLGESQLGKYDNVGPCPNKPVAVSGPCHEVYLYDSESGKLICASCNPSGESPLGRSRLPTGPAFQQRRYLTDEGRLVFESQDSLSPFDTNAGSVPGRAVEDVYEFEPEGVGTCVRVGGCVKLISAGHEPNDSNFLAMDESGTNIFFTTRDQLALKDRDDAVDLYDARENGGIPAESEVGRGECQGEACQPSVTPPNDATPGSSTFEGAGNVDEKKAAKKHKKHKKKHAKKKAQHRRAAKRNRGGAK
jgi:hypothetical protein